MTIDPTPRAPSLRLALAFAAIPFVVTCGGAARPPKTTPVQAQARPTPRAAPRPVECDPLDENCTTPAQRATHASIEHIRDELIAGSVDRATGCAQAAELCVPNTNGCTAPLMRELAFSAGCLEQMLPLFNVGPFFNEYVRADVCHALGRWMDETVLGTGEDEIPHATPAEVFGIGPAISRRMSRDGWGVFNDAKWRFESPNVLSCYDHLRPAALQALNATSGEMSGDYDPQRYLRLDNPFRVARFERRLLDCTNNTSDVRVVDACFEVEFGRAQADLALDPASLDWLRSRVRAQHAEFVRTQRSQRPLRGTGY